MAGRVFVAADMADVEAVRRLATEAGEVDVLVNNAAIFPFAPTIEQGIPDFDAMFDVNVRAPYFLTAALVPKMLAKGSGSIVDVTTIAAAVGMPGSSVYGASKAALESLARTAAPAGIAEVILFLASPRSSYLTSTTITADGGAIAV